MAIASMGNLSQGQRHGLKAFAIASLLSMGLHSCGNPIEAKSGLLDKLEQLEFVPTGEVNSRTLLQAGYFAGTTVSLLVDRFEATRSDLARAGFQSPAERGWAGIEGWDGGSLNETGAWPACMDFVEAQAYAAASGMRLPTTSEWIYIAAGRLGHRYPWGHTWQKSVANTMGLGLDRPLPVGTFEGGRGPFGTYDQIGNLWEWTRDWVPGLGDPFGAGAGLPAAGEESPYVSALGGSFSSRQRPLFWDAEAPLSFNALTLTRTHQSQEVGARCVAEAREYLLQVGGDLGDSPSSARRLRAIGARWYSTGEGDAMALLESLAHLDRKTMGFQFLLEGARQ